MSIDAIKKISETEESMKTLKSQAETDAKRARDEAEAAGQAAVSQSIELGNKEVTELIKNAEDKAHKQAQELESSSENKKAAMTAHAGANLDKAAEYIIERIVKG